MKDLHEMASRSREAFSVLSAAGAAERNRALLALANLLNLKKEEIFAANRQDLENAGKSNLAAPHPLRQ